MIRKIAFVALATLGLTACLETPDTAQGVRDHGMFRPTTVQVNRSAQSALNSMVSRAQQCLNFDSHTLMTGPTMNANIFQDYRTRREGNSLVVLYSSPNDPFNEGFHPQIVSDVVAAGSGAQVTTYAPIGSGAFIDAIHAWAAGDMRPCPKTDWF